MTSIKDSKEEIIGIIREKIEKKYAKTLSDEEILKKCLEFSKGHIDSLFEETIGFNEPISEKLKRIISRSQEYQLYDLDKSDDELLYGIPND